MPRIPGSHNAKCKEAGVDSEVKIMQEWNGFRPDYRLLIGSLHADLVGKNQERYRDLDYGCRTTPTGHLPIG